MPLSPSPAPRPLAAALLACLPAFAAAQEPAAPAAAPAAAAPALPAVTVEAASDDDNASEGTGRYTQRSTGTATRLDLSVRETPQSVTVITRQRMEDQGLTNLGEVLSQSAGITMNTGDSNTRPTTNARGFSTNTYMTDGLAEDPNWVAQAWSDMAMYDRVEVLRGAAGLVQGAGNPAGAINLVRKRPLAGFAASAGTSIGSWGSRRIEADISSPLNAAGTARARIVSAYERIGSYLPAVHSERAMLYGVVDLDLAPRTRLTVGGSILRDDTVPVATLPRLASGADPGLPRNTFLGDDYNFWNKDNRNVFAELQHGFDNGWRLRAIASQSWNRMDMLSTFVRGPLASLGSALPVYDYAYNYNQHSFAAEVSASGPFSLLGREHELVVGFNGRRQSKPGLWSYYGGGANVMRISPFLYDMALHAQAPIDYVGGGGRSFDKNSQTGLFGTARFNATDALKLIVGARVSNYQYESTSYANATGRLSANPRYEAKRRVTPYAGLTYDLDDRHTLYASYSDIFQPQGEVDASGKVLDPIVGANYEAGIKGEYLDKRLNASLAVFRIDQKNRAQDDVNGPSPCPYSVSSTYGSYCKIASGKVRSQGFELELNGAIAPDWQVAAGYTYNDTKYLEDAANQGGAFSEITPRHLLRVFTYWRLPGEWSAFSIGGGVNVQSRASYRSGSTMLASQGGYALWSLNAAWRMNDRTDLSVKIDNLFDRRYYEYLSTTAYRWGSPRRVTLALRTRF